MNDQNPNDPLDADAAVLYLKNYNNFLEKASLYTSFYANNS